MTKAASSVRTATAAADLGLLEVPPTQTTIHDVLAQFREDARSSRDLGDRFERLMQQFFRLDPIYKERFSNVYLWQDWPRRGAFADKGIDLVAVERATGDCCAIQCKFF